MAYKIHEIFHSIQGEGHNAGTPAVFIRFGGCPLTCSYCDTDNTIGQDMTLDEIIETACDYRCDTVILTGGEPLVQYDIEFNEALRPWFKRIWLETSGAVRQRAGVDYVACSPKVPNDVALKNLWSPIAELRVPFKAGDALRPMLSTARGKHFLSPIFDGKIPNQENIAAAVQAIKDNPEWRLSLQTHKLIGIR